MRGHFKKGNNMKLKENYSLRDIANIAKYASQLSVEYACKGVTYIEVTNMFVNETVEGTTIEQARNNIEMKLIERQIKK